jgi:hypothetical protein
VDIENDMAGILGLMIEFPEVAIAGADHARSRPMVQVAQAAGHAKRLPAGIGFLPRDSLTEPL